MGPISGGADPGGGAPDHERGYDQFLDAVQMRFLANVDEGAGRLFKTDASGLYDAYLAALPASDRQYHACGTCRRFFESYGGLAIVDRDGRLVPALWNPGDAPGYYRPAIEVVAGKVRRARIVGVFLSKEAIWGRPVTGTWTHYAVTPPFEAFTHPYLTAGQVTAEKAEDFKTLVRALAEFGPPLLDRALQVLQADALYRGEKIMGPVRWLRDLHARRKAVAADRRDHLTWLAVASAPPGFCKPRGTMAGTLLEDLASGMPFETVARRFKDKMHPLQYQRPQVAPAAGNIAQAEKIVAAMGIAPSLKRRFARLDEVRAVWTPKPRSAASGVGSVFAHLVAKAGPARESVVLPPTTITWEKFARTVLPGAESIDYFAVDRPSSYAALVTAVEPDAPPILQWDRPDRRNPVSWYLWHDGSRPSQFGLAPNTWHDVASVTLKPSMWDDPQAFKHQGSGVLFILRGAQDTRMPGAALFPEILRAELHPVRATIESFSARAQMEGREKASACGIMLIASAGATAGPSWDARFRVTSAGVRAEYVLDRWD